jgi:hypothetical protein
MGAIQLATTFAGDPLPCPLEQLLGASQWRIRWNSMRSFKQYWLYRLDRVITKADLLGANQTPLAPRAPTPRAFPMYIQMISICYFCAFLRYQNQMDSA